MVLTILLAACRPDADPRGGPAAPTQGVSVVLDVRGMHCEACAEGIRFELVSLDGVHEAHVTFEPPQARVWLDTNRMTSPQLIEVIRAAGYDADVARAPGSAGEESGVTNDG